MSILDQIYEMITKKIKGKNGNRILSLEIGIDYYILDYLDGSNTFKTKQEVADYLNEKGFKIYEKHGS